MNPRRLLTVPCTIERLVEGAKNEYGNVEETWTNGDASLCWTDLRGRTTDSSEAGAPADWQINTIDIYLLPDSTITGRDRVTVNGETFEVLGPPHTFVHPRNQREIYTHAVGRRID